MRPHFHFVPGSKVNSFPKMAFVFVAFLAFIFGSKEARGLYDSCVHGGTKYKEGDHFLPNDTLIKTESPHECVQCRCRQGLVLCEIENCPLLECETPARDPSFCCLRCPEVAESGNRREIGSAIPETALGLDLDESPDVATDAVVLEEGSSEGSRTGCFSGGRYLENGTVWQPVMGPFGVMACVRCRCREGTVLCARPKCLEPSCSRPRTELGRCCPVCPGPAESTKKVSCLSKTTELFVFKTPNVRNNSGKIEYAFLENAPSGWSNDLVKIHSWNLRPKGGADVFAFRLVSRKEFRASGFQIIGSISRKRFRKYSKREKKLRSNCLSNCLAKVERLENSLLDRGVNARNRCTQDEIDVADI